MHLLLWQIAKGSVPCHHHHQPIDKNWEYWQMSTSGRALSDDHGAAGLSMINTEPIYPDLQSFQLEIPGKVGHT